MSENFSVVGRTVTRRGLEDKVTGQARYTADIKLARMLHARVLRSPHPHAEILSIDASEAQALPGVHAIITPFDAEASGRLAPDMTVLDTTVRFAGDEVAAVAAEDEGVAEQAMELIKVEYRVLPFVTDAEDALRPGAPRIHPEGNLYGGEPITLERGSVEEGFKEADLVLEGTYRVASHSAAPLEPRAALADWEGDSLTVWKTSRGIHQDRGILAQALSLPLEKVRVVGPTLGAGYGNKDESRASTIAALLSRKAGRPVRLEYSRYEEFVAGRVRHSAVIRLKVGAKKDGSITAISNRTVMNTGAYLASGGGVLRRAAQGSLYLYRCSNVRYEGYLAYTNSPVAGSYRGLGAPQGHFALEAHMDRLAEALGMDPLEFRLKNHVGPEGQPGQRTTPRDEIVDAQPLEGGIPFSSNGLKECLQRGARAIGWGSKPPSKSPTSQSLKHGTGVAMCIYRGGPGRDSTAKVIVHREGRIELVTGIMDVGEGAHTVLAQMAAEALGCRYEDVNVVAGDTATTLEAPITAGSTATFSSGLAVRQAAAEVRSRLLDLASTFLEIPKDRIDISGGLIFPKGDSNGPVTLTEIAAQMPDHLIEATATVTPGSRDYIINSFAAHFAQVEVNVDTGKVRVVRYVAAHDSGKIINPSTALNQVEGGVSQMLGLALTEELVTDAYSGVTLNGSFLEHKCPTIAEYPEMDVIFVETEDPEGPFGAKALGEPPSVPVAAAVVNAIYDAIGIRLTEIPVTPDKVLTALKERAGAAHKGL